LLTTLQVCHSTLIVERATPCLSTVHCNQQTMRQASSLVGLILLALLVNDAQGFTPLHNGGSIHLLTKHHAHRSVSLASGDTSYLESIQLLMSSESGTWSKQEWHQAIGGVKYCKEMATADSIEIAWNLLDRLVQEKTQAPLGSSSRDAPLDDKLLSIIVYAWTQTPSKVSATTVLAKVELYQSMYPRFLMSISLYNMIMDTAIKRGERYSHDLANDVLQSLIKRGPESTVRPDTVTFTIAIDALAKSGARNATQRAEALLQQMKDLSNDGWDNLKPNIRTYNALISTLANSKQPGAAQRAEELLIESPQPSTISFNAVMDAWSKSNDAGSGERCYQIFQHMKKLYQDGNHDNLKPCAISYGIVINALAKNGRVRDAETILMDLFDTHTKTNDPDLVPNRLHFNSLLDACAKGGKRISAKKADEILNKMSSLAFETNNTATMPNLFSFNSVLHFWSKSNDPMSTIRAEAILQRMQELDEAGFPGVKPNVRSYNSVLDCFSNSRSKDAAGRAEAILTKMIDRYIAGQNDVKPNTASFSTVITAYARSRDQGAVAKAESVFKRMKELDVRPDTTTFSTMMSAWTNSRDPQAATKVEDYLNELKQLYEAGDVNCEPNSFVFNVVINAWSTSKDRVAQSRARALLKEMKSWVVAGHVSCAPNVVSYNSLLNVVARSKSSDKAVLAFDILTEMKESSIQPDDRTFGTVMMACAFSNGYERAAREQAFTVAVKTMIQAYAETKPSKQVFNFFFKAAAGLGHDKPVNMVYDWCCEAGFENDELITSVYNPSALYSRIKPLVSAAKDSERNTTTLNTHMDALSKSDDPGSPDRCFQIFQQMKKLYISGNENVKPDQASYGSVISAFARKGRASEAAMVLQEFLDEYERTKDPGLAPDRSHFNSLIVACSKSGEQGAAQKAEAILEQMHILARATSNAKLLPDVTSFASVLQAWAQSDNPLASSRAEAILQRMHELDQSGLPDMKPNYSAYSAVLDCLANSKSKDAAVRAETVIQGMMDRYIAGDEDCKPDVIAFNSVIGAFAKSREPDAAKNAESIFQRMKAFGVHPTKGTYTVLISTLTNSGDPAAATKADCYLRDLNALYRAGDEQCKPDQMSFNAVINAWSTSKDPNMIDRARGLLQEMQLLEASGDMDCRPNVVTYNSLINVIAKSTAEDKACLAWDMDERSIRPEDRTFGSVMMVCAFSNNFGRPTRERAFDIAEKVIHRAHAEAKVSSQVFSFFFTAAAGLGRDKEVESAYKLCCKAGFEDDAWIQRAIAEAAPHLIRE
jgi:pentatricopeptide repeat protein